MTYPGPAAYQEALQHPSTAFVDPELAAGKPRLNALGLPQPITGAFAAVFPVDTDAGRYAARCFLTEVRDHQQRYRSISRFLDTADLNAFVRYEYQHRGMRLGADVYPILKMEWAEGRPLNQYVHDHLAFSGVLEALSRAWIRLLVSLRDAGIAHGDLQHGNVLVRGGRDTEPRITLVDYDTMFVPALRGKRSPELGHRNYQHPERSASQFDASLDHFSGLAIYVAIRALVHRPDLWARHDTGENLLFQADDFYQPSQSQLFAALRGIREISAAVSVLEASCYSPPERTPFLIDVLRGHAPVPRRTPGKRFRRRREGEPERARLAHSIRWLLPAAPLVAAGVALIHPVAGLGLLLVVLTGVFGLAYRAYGRDESRRRRRRLLGEISQIERLIGAYENELAALETERRRFVDDQDALRKERLAEIRQSVMEDHLKYHFIGELEQVEGVAHRVVVRLKRAGIRTAYHVTPDRVNAVPGIGDESKRRVLIWHAALMAELQGRMPTELSASEIHRLERHVERRLEELDIETARLREKIAIQRAETQRVTRRLDDTPRRSFLSYLAGTASVFGRAPVGPEATRSRADLLKARDGKDRSSESPGSVDRRQLSDYTGS